MSTDLLEERLQRLVIDFPDPGRVTARVIGRNLKHKRRWAPRVGAASVATLTVLALVAYFVPSADLAVATVPGASDILRQAGLVGAADRVTFVGAVADSSGYRIELVGAYADASRTVLLLRGTPSFAPSDNVLQITDQFGRSYQFRYGYADTRTGDTVLQFEPLAWPDLATGARISLHMSQVGTADPPYTPVQGSWTLGVVLRVDEARRLPAPGPATLGPAHFTFSSLTYTPASIVIDIDVTGINRSAIERVIPDGLKGTPIFGIDLFDPAGTLVNGAYDINGPGELSTTPSGVHVHFIGYRMGHGNYILKVRYDQDTFVRTLTIP
jgi:hypothetical protein